MHSSTYAGATVGIPLDGDMLLLYYRRDLFERFRLALPETWDDMLALATHMNGTDVDGDGDPELLGACFDVACKARQSFCYAGSGSP
jgi:multiple sugar transport system substrate-binding protein